MTAAAQQGAGRRWLRIVVVLCALAAFAGFIALGTWQLERRAWKLDLIERVTQRVQAPPVSAPEPADWPRIERA
ncbi:MAG: SURF1 family protein, partial [Haliea sp.]